MMIVVRYSPDESVYYLERMTPGCWAYSVKTWKTKRAAEKARQNPDKLHWR